MLDDLTKTIKAQLYERATSPLLGTFALSWAAWNYRFVLLLISSMPVAEKISYIDVCLFPTWKEIVLRGSIYPILTCCFMIFAYPYPAKIVYGYWRSRQRELKEIQQKIDDESPMSKEEARQIRRDTRKISEEYEQELNKKNTEINDLRERINELTKLLSENKPLDDISEKSNHNNNYNISETQYDILVKIANSQYPRSRNDFIDISKDRITTEYDINELINNKFVEEKFNPKDDIIELKATHKGLTYIVNMVKF